MTSTGQKTQTTNKMYKCDRNKRNIYKKKKKIEYLQDLYGNSGKTLKKLTYKERMPTFIQI